MNKILIAIDITLLVSYVGSIWIANKKVPKSISETAYILESDCDHKANLHRYYGFTSWSILTAGLIFWPWICATDDMWRFLCWWGCVGLIMCGVTPLFKDKEQNLIHYTGAGLAFASMIAWMIINGYWFNLTVGLVLTVSLIALKSTSWLLWCEICMILTLFVTLLLA